MKKNKKTFFRNEYLILGLMIIFGIILRLAVLYEKDIWFDEALTYYFAGLPVIRLINAVLLDSNPPLYYLFIHFWLKLGSNDLFLRLPSMFFNLSTIPLIYILGKKLLNRTVGFYAAFLFTVSPLSVYLSTEARLHGLALFLITLTILLFFNLQASFSLTKSGLFLVSLTASLYTQYYALLLVPAFTLIVLQKQNKLFVKSWIKMLVIIIILYLPWLIPVLFFPHNRCNCPNTILSLPSALISPQLGGVGEITLRSYFALPKSLWLFFGGSASISFYLFLKGLKLKQSPGKIYLIPLIILSLGGLFWPVFSPKAFAVFCPLYFIILALGISKNRHRGLVFLTVTIFYLITNFIQLFHPNFAGTKIKPFLPIIKTQPNLMIAHTSSATYYPWSFYTLSQNQNILLTANPYPENFLRFIPGQTSAIKNSEDKFWLVDTPNLVDVKARHQILNQLSPNCLMIYKYPNQNVILSLCQKK